MKTLTEKQGFFSMIASFLILAVVGIMLSPVATVTNEFIAFVSGNIEQITLEKSFSLKDMPIICLIIAFSLLLEITLHTVTTKFLGDGGKHAVAEKFQDKTPKKLFYFLFIAVVIEELFARWFFLGVLGKIPWLQTKTSFYFLFLVGNGIWALIHLYNFKQKEKRHWLRVFPQFVGGVFLTYVYVKFGLIASILCHFMYNAVLASYTKLEKTTVKDFFQIAIAVSLCLICALLMSKSPKDCIVWLEGSIVSLKGWTNFDYFLLLVLVNHLVFIIGTALLYDKATIENNKKYDILALILVSVVVILCVYCMNWLLTFIVPSLFARILLINLAICFMTTNPSPSGAIRAFWGGLGTIFPSLVILIVLPFIDGFMIVSGLLIYEESMKFISKKLIDL